MPAELVAMFSVSLTAAQEKDLLTEANKNDMKKGTFARLLIIEGLRARGYAARGDEGGEEDGI